MKIATRTERNTQKLAQAAAAVESVESTEVVAAEAVEAEEEQLVEAAAEEQQAIDTGSASEQDLVFVLGEAGSAVQGLGGSPLAYVGGVFGSSLVGGGAGGFVPQVGVGGVVSGDNGEAAAVAVEADDAVVSVGSIEVEAEEAAAEDVAVAAAEEAATEEVVFEATPEGVNEEALNALSQIASQQVAAAEQPQTPVFVAPLQINGLIDNSGVMRVMYGEGAELADSTPVVSGVVTAGTRVVVIHKGSGEVLGTTHSDDKGQWSLELPELASGVHELGVQTIAMDREEASISFQVADLSPAVIQSAADTKTWLSTGTEDEAYVFTRADYLGLSEQADIKAVEAIRITQLPADGKLQYKDANGDWVDASANQMLAMNDIADGGLRFVPMANASGSAAYNTDGVGNQKKVYAEMGVEVIGVSAATINAEVKLQMAITPVIDNSQTISGSVARVGSVAGLAAGSWGRYSFNVSGNIGDTDGSERSLIEVIPANRNTTFAVLTGTVYNTVMPDAAGKIFLNPGQTLFVKEYSIGGQPGSSIQFKLLGQEIDGADVLLSKDLSTLRTLQAVQPPPPPPVYDPLILDLDGNGVQTSTVDDGVAFDAFANGTQVQVAWTDGKDGFLVFDRNGDGTINDGSELFGDYTLLNDGGLAKDGFEALRDLDSNLDGIFDAQDALFEQVQVWVDANRDGVSAADELLGLTELGIQAIHLRAVSSERMENGNHYGLISKFVRHDGGESEVVDVWLESRPLDIQPEVFTVI